MNKPVACFDIDRTMYDGFSYFPLLDHQTDAGIVSKKYKNKAYELYYAFRAGDLGYESLVRELISIYALALKGRSEQEVRKSTKDFFYNSSDFYKFVGPTVKHLSESHDVVIATGSTQFTAEAISELFSIPRALSSQITIVDGLIDGTVTKYLSTRDEKRIALTGITKDTPRKGSFGFGDSEGDIEMLRMVENAICIHPTDELRALAEKENWSIVDTDDELRTPVVLRAVKSALDTQ